MLSSICFGRSKTFFYWFCYIFEIAILYWKPMRNFLLKINWFASFKNFRISLNFLIGIFKDIFLLILLYFWNCHFILKTNTNFSIENQLLFASIIFLLKINTKISIELPVHFQLAILYWKSIQFFLSKINWFLSASFFSIENQLSCKLQYYIVKLPVLNT